VEGLEYTNLVMKNVRTPFYISAYYPHEPKNPADDVANTPGDRSPVYRNMVFKNIKAIDADRALIIWGIPESPVENLRFEDVHISAKTGMQINNAIKLRFEKCSFIVQKGEKLQIFQSDVSGL
jgi:hypothetical protein